MDESVTAKEIASRQRRIAMATNGPLLWGGWIAIGAVVATGILIVLSVSVTREPRIGVIVAGIAVLVSAAVLLLPFRTLRLAQAAEFQRDHACREAREWTAFHGSPLPKTRKGLERWLDEHPRGSGRVTVLMILGRLDQAALELTWRRPSDPEETFEAALLAAQIETLRGHPVEVGTMRELQAAIPDPARRTARAQCIVGLEAWMAVNHGDDAPTVLAAGRREIGLLDPASRIVRIHLGLLALPGMTALTAALVLALLQAA